MNYTDMIKERLQYALQYIHDQEAETSDLLTSFQRGLDLSELSGDQRNQLAKIMVMSEFHAYLRASFESFGLDYIRTSPVELRATAFRLEESLTEEQLIAMHWILEEVLPYQEECRARLAVRHSEDLIDLLHLLDHLAFMTEEIKEEEDTRHTWMFDWVHALKRDVRHYGLFLQPELLNIKVKEDITLPRSHKWNHVKIFSVSEPTVVFNNWLTREEKKYVEWHGEGSMAFKNNSAPDYSVDLST